MVVEELDMHLRPISDLFCSHVLPEGPVIVQPAKPAKLIICLKNLELVACQISPSMWERRAENEIKNGKGFHPQRNVCNWTLNQSCGSCSGMIMF